MDNPKENAFSPLGFAIGLPLGLPIAFALDNVALFPVFGLLFGVVLAVALPSNKDEE